MGSVPYKTKVNTRGHKTDKLCVTVLAAQGNCCRTLPFQAKEFEGMVKECVISILLGQFSKSFNEKKYTINKK